MNQVDDRIQLKLDRIEQSHRIERGNSALIVVDMQHGFLDEGASLEVPKGRKILPNIVRLVTACLQIWQNKFARLADTDQLLGEINDDSLNQD